MSTLYGVLPASKRERNHVISDNFKFRLKGKMAWMSRVIVCKMGRFGELRKLVDCPLADLR